MIKVQLIEHGYDPAQHLVCLWYKLSSKVQNNLWVITSSFCVKVRRSTDVFFLKEAAFSQLINKVLDEVMRNVEDYRSFKKYIFPDGSTTHPLHVTLMTICKNNNPKLGVFVSRIKNVACAVPSITYKIDQYGTRTCHDKPSWHLKMGTQLTTI